MNTEKRQLEDEPKSEGALKAELAESGQRTAVSEEVKERESNSMVFSRSHEEENNSNLGKRRRKTQDELKNQRNSPAAESSQIKKREAKLFDKKVMKLQKRLDEFHVTQLEKQEEEDKSARTEEAQRECAEEEAKTQKLHVHEETPQPILECLNNPEENSQSEGEESQQEQHLNSQERVEEEVEKDEQEPAKRVIMPAGDESSEENKTPRSSDQNDENDEEHLGWILGRLITQQLRAQVDRNSLDPESIFLNSFQDTGNVGRPPASEQSVLSLPEVELAKR